MLPHLDQIKANFRALNHWDDRFKYLIQIGKQLPPFPETEKTAENKVLGCMSNVWIVVKNPEAENPEFIADSDASIVKGLIAVILSALQNKTPKEIITLDIQSLFAELELDQHLSPSRTNGFFAMIKKIQHTTLLFVHQKGV